MNTILTPNGRWHWRYLAATLLIIGVSLQIGCSSPEQKKAKFFATGKAYLAKKDFARAILQFKNAVQLDPKDAEAHYQLAQTYLAADGVQQAAVELYKATDLDPKHSKAQLSLSELMAGSSDMDLVAEAYKRASVVAATSPENAEALTTLAITELRLGHAQDAERDTLKALEKAPASLKPTMLLVGLKLARKDLAGAEELLKHAAETDPRSAEAALSLGRFYRAMKRLPEAETEIRKACAVDPANGSCLVELAGVYVVEGRKDLAEDAYRKAAALPDPHYKAMHALFLFMDSRPDAAIAELKELHKSNPNLREIRTLLVRAYLTTGKVNEAADLLSRVLAENPKDLDALLNRAAIRISAGQYDDAQKDLAPVLSARPDLSEAHYLMARIHHARGSVGSYRQELEEALRRDARNVRARLALASLLITSNASQAALELLDRTPPEQSANVEVTVQRSGALMASGQNAVADKLIETGLKTSRDPELLVQAALVKLQNQDVTNARKYLEEVLSRNPEHRRALNTLISTYRSQSQLSVAISKLQEYLVQRPQSVVLLTTLASVYTAAGELDKARVAFNAAKAASPNDASVAMNLVQLDLVENKLVEARQALAPLAAGGNQRARMLLAEVEERNGNSTAAMEQYRKILDVDPRNAAALNNLAFTLASTSKSDEALGYAQQAKEVAPADMAVEDTLGWIYYCRGNYATAVPYFENAVAKAPSARRKYHLAMAYLQIGNRERAAPVLDQALKMDPKLPEARVAEALFGGSPEKTPARPAGKTPPTPR